MSATFQQPNFTTMSAAAYKAAIDASFAALARLAGVFCPHQQDQGSPSPDLTVRIDGGFVLDGTTLIEVAAQTVSGFTIPSSGEHRIDRVVIDASTGVASRVAGTAVTGSPSATPPAIPSGNLPCCQVLITSSDVAILNAMITDERVPSVTNAFPSGTKMLFQQTSAPTGWTKDTTHNDKALRVVSGSASSGGATAFTTVFGSGKTTGSTTLTTSHLPASGLSVPGLSVPALSIPALSVNIKTFAGTGGGGPNAMQSAPDGALVTTATTSPTTLSDVGSTGGSSTGGGTTGGGTTGNMGAGVGHDHTLSLDLHYVDVIIATKD